MTRELPDNSHLAYTINHENIWWSKLPEDMRPDDGRRSVYISASKQGRGGGARWEMSVVEKPNIGLKLGIFDETWPAFQEIPDFFLALASERPGSLDEVVRLLDRLGAVDETKRAEAGV